MAQVIEVLVGVQIGADKPFQLALYAIISTKFKDCRNIFVAEQSPKHLL